MFRKNLFIMKNLLFITILIISFISCEKDKIDEVPDNISILKPVPQLVDSLEAYFPDNESTLIAYPSLFSDTCQKNIVLKKDSEVYVTFMDEGAGLKNSLCWYSYTKSKSAPLKVADIKGHLLFPNISKVGEGGQLESGYTLQLGTEMFSAGTVIGFFLVQDGWQGGTIDYSHPTFYTDYYLNTAGRQQHILFKDSYFKYVLIGFEDMEFDNIRTDKDFNDIIFSVTDNKKGIEATSFDLSHVIIK
jgi:hypothetical protein